MPPLFYDEEGSGEGVLMTKKPKSPNDVEHPLQDSQQREESLRDALKQLHQKEIQEQVSTPEPSPLEESPVEYAAMLPEHTATSEEPSEYVVLPYEASQEELEYATENPEVYPEQVSQTPLLPTGEFSPDDVIEAQYELVPQQDALPPGGGDPPPPDDGEGEEFPEEEPPPQGIQPEERQGILRSLVYFGLTYKLPLLILCFLLTGLGFLVAPFGWEFKQIPRSPLQMSALPSPENNQHFVWTAWPNHSPVQVQKHITSPLTTILMGLSGVKTVRSSSHFGFSSIQIRFEKKMAFQQARMQILQALQSLPSQALPKEAKPQLGPDATLLGKVFWYTLEGRDKKGKPSGGWDLHELRKVQDRYLRLALRSVKGVAEVASIGGFTQAYRIDVHPEKLKSFGLTLSDLYKAIQESSRAMTTRTIEVNRVEYILRTTGGITKSQDLEDIVVRVHQGNPIPLKALAKVTLVPSRRDGILSKDGSEAVGGIVITRHDANPTQTLKRLKVKITQVAPSLPKKVLASGKTSQLTIVPYYDHSQFIQSTLKNFEHIFSLELLMALLISLLVLLHLRASILLSGLLPMVVFIAFLVMKCLGIGANVMVLSGLAIAMGILITVGVVLLEKTLEHLRKADAEASTLRIVFASTTEVAIPAYTALFATILCFSPMLFLPKPVGELFGSLALTITFALLAVLLLSLLVLPGLAHLILRKRTSYKEDETHPIYRALRLAYYVLLLVVGLFVMRFVYGWLGWFVIALAGYYLSSEFMPRDLRDQLMFIKNVIVIGAVIALLFISWQPLGAERGLVNNGIFLTLLISVLYFLGRGFLAFYPTGLRVFLRYKTIFLFIPLSLGIWGFSIWQGWERTLGWIPATFERVGISSSWLRDSGAWRKASQIFPGLQTDVTPTIQEGSFVFTPATMPHASTTEATDVLQKLTQAIRNIPEVRQVVGKVGRAQSALDANSMTQLEILVQYKAKYTRNKDGEKVRQWRSHIYRPQDIWREVIQVSKIPGTTLAPRLSPIAANRSALRTGTNTRQSIQLRGPSVQAIEQAATHIATQLKDVPEIDAETISVTRRFGKPYLELKPKRKVILQMGLRVADVERALRMSLNGQKVARAVQAQGSKDIIVRYHRNDRFDLNTLKRIMLTTPQGRKLPLFRFVQLHYTRGPQVIRSENGLLVGEIRFDVTEGTGQTKALQAAAAHLHSLQKSKHWKLPQGVTFSFTGKPKGFSPVKKRLFFLVPVVFALLLLLFSLPFRSVSTAGFILCSGLIACSGGFLFLWFYQQPWFLNISLFGTNLQEAFQVHPIHMNAAVWSGLIVLFGVTLHHSTILATRIQHALAAEAPKAADALRAVILQAGKESIRPILLATMAILLLCLPAMTLSGNGLDLMLPAAVPLFGGMLLACITLFTMPLLTCWREEFILRRAHKKKQKQKTAVAQAQLEQEYLESNPYSGSQDLTKS